MNRPKLRKFTASIVVGIEAETEEWARQLAAEAAKRAMHEPGAVSAYVDQIIEGDGQAF